VTRINEKRETIFAAQQFQRFCAAERRQNVQMIGQSIETRGN
jgi:hypothetical protein